MGGWRGGPKVSVIIPVYNTEKYLAGCVRSVQAQTYENLEILLADDGSTDGSRDLCERLREGDGRVRFLAGAHGGVSAARNRALDAHTGEYVFFMDSDDLLHPSLIEQCLRHLMENQADLIYCAYTRFLIPPEDDGTAPAFPRPVLFPPRKIRLLFRQGMLRGIGGKFVRSRFIEEMRFDEGLTYGEDALFNYQMLLKGARVLFYNAPWYYYRQRPESAVATVNEHIGAKLDSLKRLRDYAYAGLDAPDGEALDALKWERALLAALRSSYLRARGLRRKSLCRDLRERFLAESEHPMFARLTYRERAAFRLCFESPLAYRAAGKAARLYKCAGKAAASARRDGRAPVCKAVQNGGEKRVAITFDADYGADNTEKILDILEKNKARATFFVSGIWVDAFPDKAAELRERGCEVMNYSDTHVRLTQCRREEILEELESGSRKIEEATGIRPALMRCPYGEHDARVLECVEEMGMRAVQWSVDSLDWKETATEEEIYRRVLSQAGPGGIIRCCNAGRYTPGALERILASLKEEGYRFVLVSELLSSAANMP